LAFFATHEGGAGYDFVVESLRRLFMKQGVIPPPDSFAEQRPIPIRPVALIFGRPVCPIFRDELLPDRRYYHLRSGVNVELFYMGYADPDKEYVDVGDFDENDFSDESFVSAVSDFEDRTTWKYSSSTDLLLLNSFFTPRQRVDFDFTNVFAIQFEAAVKTGLIESGRALIEEIMRQSRYFGTEDVVLRTSDVVFLRNASRSFSSWVLGILKLKPEDIENAYRSCVRNISRHTTAAG
jgi:hypothetical protein